MAILLLTQVFPPRTGGSGRWLWELYRRLSGIEVEVVAGDVPGATAFDSRSALPTTRISLDFASWGLLHVRGIADYARGLRALNGVIRRSQPDVIHCGKCLPEGLLAAAVKQLKGIPFACYVHGEELALAKTTRELAFLTRLVLRRATTIVANSHHSKAMLISAWSVPDAKIAVMHPGVDTVKFTPAPADDRLRSRLGWTNRPVVLTVGALQKRKGQDMMIRALPAIRERCPEVLYAVVGEGWEQESLERLAAEHGVTDAVQFRGVPDDNELVALYQQCDLFALPNRQVGWDFEGFGMALVEAQACGRPVIAGKSGGAPETMRPGETGLLVSCEAPDALADATVSLLQQPALRAAMGQRARQWAVEQFDWGVQTSQARAVFSGTI